MEDFESTCQYRQLC